MSRITQDEWDDKLNTAWDAYFATHGGRRRHGREKHSPASRHEWQDLSDAEKIERYLTFVNTPGNDQRFKNDVTEQLYHLTELAIWLYKRLPMRLIQREDRTQGTNGKRPTRPVSKTTKKNPAAKLRKEVAYLLEVTEEGVGKEPAVVRAQSHDTPPPPPEWPPQP
jgi:hypothetical protein